jgi:glucosylceramidase
VPFGTRAFDNLASITVNPDVQYQTIEGFGGAFTEAAATTLRQMPADVQDAVMAVYFDPAEGLGYTLCRTHINSCDFSLGNYAYNEVPDDFALEQFDISRDQQALIPMIQRARALAGDDLRIFASPWSPPAWMKTSGQMNEGGKLRPECREVWARYYARYIRAYAAEGIPIWGLTVQNEPAAVQPWDSCIWTGEDERDFVRDHLGPTLEAEGMSDVKIIVWDHNRDLLYERAAVVLSDPDAAKYVWGVGFHWYVQDAFDNVQLVHDAFPDTHLLLTEACVEVGPHLDDWSVGERYARSIIQDLNHWAVGWVDWNLLLNAQGGPNHVHNYCSAPIMADTATGELQFQNSYYYLGHFSRFIRPGARRVLAASTRDALEVTAARNTDGSIAVVVLNRGDAYTPLQLKYRGEVAVALCPGHAMMTLVVNAS